MLNYTQYNDKKYIIYQSDKYNDGKPKPPFHDDKKMIEITMDGLHVVMCTTWVCGYYPCMQKPL